MSLQAEYDRQHADGYWSSHSKGARMSETAVQILDQIEWAAEMVDKDEIRVLDLGFGTGEIAHSIAKSGFTVVGVDFSAEAVKAASSYYHHPDLTFLQGDFSSAEKLGPFDIIVSAGTVEHTDDPAESIQQVASALSPGGIALITCPHFDNKRGAVWMALHAVGAVMSKTDRHFIRFSQMDEWATSAGLVVEGHMSFDDSWGYGVLCIEDMEDRIPKACRDGGLELRHFDDLMDWLRESTISGEGATALYALRKPQ